MSEKSDEELVGDVDLDLDIDVQEDKRKSTSLHSSKHGKPSQGSGNSNVKTSLKTKTVVKQSVQKLTANLSPLGDDLLQAFSMDTTFVPKTKKTSQVIIAKKRKEMHQSGLASERSATKSEVKRSKTDGPLENVKKERQQEVAHDPVKTSSTLNDKCKSKVETVKEIKHEVKEQIKHEVKEQIRHEVKEQIKHEVKASSLEKGTNDKKETKLKVNQEQGESSTTTEKVTQVRTSKVEFQEDIKSEESYMDQLIADCLSKDLQQTASKESENCIADSLSKDLKKKASKESENVTNVKDKDDLSKSLTSSMTEQKSNNLFTTENEKSTKPPVKRKAEDHQSSPCTESKSKKTEHSLSQSQSKDDANEKKGVVEIPEERMTDEDLKSLENCLAEEMLNRVRQKPLSRMDARYTVHVSPLEISDLAEPSVQQIIQLHPTMALIFKHQTVKFKKKKGFAEATFSTMTELKEFVYQLTQIHVSEKKIEVVIRAVRKDQNPDVLSLVIHLNRNGKLLKLIGSGEDPMISKPLPLENNLHKVQFEQVPSTANAAFMHSMFPFTNNIVITRDHRRKEKKPLYNGPLSVFYISPKWSEAVLDCCTDFTVNGYLLSVIKGSTSDESSDTNPSGRRGGSSTTSHKQKETSRQDSMDDIITADGSETDDPVANMTRDVCADMLESLQKLRELEPDNPNMKKIVQMQDQLNTLKKSVSKFQKRELTEQVKESGGEDNKTHRLTLKEKKEKEMDELEKWMDETVKDELHREEQSLRQMEMEQQKMREHSMMKKSQWARKVLSDFKLEGGTGGKLSDNAEKFLKQREQRMKEREEEEKRREEERLRQQQRKKEEEEEKEAERQRLIQKIEEARLRDSQRTEKLSASKLIWDESDKSSGSPSAKRDRESDQRTGRSKEEAKSGTDSRRIDDAMDRRLANFERELAAQGKIERHSVSVSHESSDKHYNKTYREEVAPATKTISEEEYSELCTLKRLHTLPPAYRVRLLDFNERLCPVQKCPAKTCFRDKVSFMEHWSIFHQAQTTMRFCQRCSAYFMNREELENHMMKHHRLTSKEAYHLVQSARVKVIPNPSYRDPAPFVVL